jgi:hypothetical protein
VSAFSHAGLTAPITIAQQSPHGESLNGWFGSTPIIDNSEPNFGKASGSRNQAMNLLGILG